MGHSRRGLAIVGWEGPLAAAALTFAVRLTVSAQSPPQFQTRIDLTAIDVTVVDASGRGVSDLGPGDFTVRVDGVPRRVISAEWIPRTTRAHDSAVAPPSPGYSSNEGTPGGRLVLLVIDQPNIRFGGVIPFRSAIRSFIDRLQPEDRVSVLNLGVGARSITFTANRERAKEIVGTSTGGIPHPPSAKSPGEQTVDVIRALVGTMQQVDAPKTLVLISQGLPFDDLARRSMDDLQRIAATARTSIYAVQLIADQVTDISQKDPDAALGPPAAQDNGGGGEAQRLPDAPLPTGPAGDRGAGGIEAVGELEALAAATGGTMFSVAANADSALARIEAELTGSYLIAVESSARDTDDGSHTVAVDVNRSDLKVRSARYLRNRRTAPVTTEPRDAVATALASPLPVSALRLRIATMASPDDDRSKVKLLIRAQVGTDYRAAKRIELGLIVIDGDGRIVDTRGGAVPLLPLRSDAASPLQYSGSVSVPPGEYTLKLAVADGDRIGSVEHPVIAKAD
jgi:VWFA-related protein